MFEFSNDELILFAEKNGHVKVYNYSLINNNVNLIKDAGPLTLYQAAQISSTDYLLAAEEGVYRYNSTNNSASSVAAFSCHDIEIDEVNDLYYCSSDSSVHILSGAFLETGVVQMTDSVLGVRVEYNK